MQIQNDGKKKGITFEALAGLRYDIVAKVCAKASTDMNVKVWQDIVDLINRKPNNEKEAANE
jgi:hypothetical protein